MNDERNLLDIAHRIVASGESSYLTLQEELLKMTGADICSFFLSESQIANLQISHRDGISSSKVREYLENLARKLCFQDRRITNSRALTLRQFWKEHNHNKQVFAAIFGSSEKLARQLSKKEYFFGIKISSNSERLMPHPSQGELINRESLKIDRSKPLAFEGEIKFDQLILPKGSSTTESILMANVIDVAKFHLLPPYSFSIISIPLGFTYSLDFREREFISIELSWLGTENAYAIDLEIDVIDKAIKLCRCVAHEVITNSIDQVRLLSLIWNIDALVCNASLTPREREALELILKNYDDVQIKQYFAPCEKTGRPGINPNSVTQLLQKLRDKIKSHIQGNELTRAKLQEQNIVLTSFPTALVKRALMCSEYYRGSKP